MVRSQSRPPDSPQEEAPPALEPEPQSGSILRSVFDRLWKKKEEAPIPVVKPEWLVYQQVSVQVPRPLLYAILAVQAVILCLQVAHLVSP